MQFQNQVTELCINNYINRKTVKKNIFELNNEQNRRNILAHVKCKQHLLS